MCGRCVREGSGTGESWQEAIERILERDGEGEEWMRMIEEERGRGEVREKEEVNKEVKRKL